MESAIEYAPTVARPRTAGLRRHRLRGRTRAAVITASLGAVAGALFIASLAIGSTYVAPLDVFLSLAGLSENSGIDFIVRELRLPSAASALAVGLALGIAGALFQRVLNNPLAAPELIGVSEGASLAAVAGIVLFAWTGYALPAAALGGAVVGAAVIYALAWRGGVNGFRLILIGLGAAELMVALQAYMLARSELKEAQEAMHWLVGSIGQAGTDELLVLVAGIAVLAPAAFLLHRSLSALQLGDDAARALGVRVEGARLALIAVAIALVGLATAVAGPIAFVGLVAGPIAARLLGPSRASLLAAGFIGASIVLAADLIAQYALPVALPTGVVTGAVGAPYLLFILVAMNRQGRES